MISGCRARASGETGSGSSTTKQRVSDRMHPGSTGMSLCPMAVASQTHNGLHCLRPSSGSHGRCSRRKAGITEDPSSPEAPANCPPAFVVSPAGWSERNFLSFSELDNAASEVFLDDMADETALADLQPSNTEETIPGP